MLRVFEKIYTLTYTKLNYQWANTKQGIIFKIRNVENTFFTHRKYLNDAVVVANIKTPNHKQNITPEAGRLKTVP